MTATAPEVGHAFVSLIPSMQGFSKKTVAALQKSGVDREMSNTLTTSATRAGSRAGGAFSRTFARSAARSASIGVPRPFEASFIRNVRTYGFALSAITGLTVGLGLKTASSFEQAQIAFTTILGSAKQAKALFGDLVQFAKKTPFELPGVVSAAQQLLAFSFTAKRIKPTLTALGDAASGLGLGADGLNRMVIAIGQIQAKGRVQADELLQLTEAGVPALQILANAFGTTTANIQSLVQKGLVPADKAIPALLSGLENGTKGLAGTTARFGGLMRKQSHTLGGIVSNLRDTISVGLAKAVKPLVPVLKREIPQAMKALPGIFAAAARDMGEFLHGLGVARDRSKGAVTGFEQFGSVVRGIAHALRSTFQFIGKHLEVFKVLAVTIGGAIAAYKTFTVVQWLLNAAMDANPIGIIITAIGALVAGLIYAYKKSETFRNIVNTVFHAVQRVVGSVVWAVVKYFKFMADVWFSVVGKILDVAVAVFGHKIFGPLNGAVKGAQAAFNKLRSGVDSTLSGIANDAAHWGNAAGSNLAAGFGNGFFNTWGGVANQIQGALGVFHEKFDFGSGAFGGGKWDDKKTAKNAGSTIPLDISDGMDKNASKVKKSMSSIVDKILGPLKDLVAKAKQLASSVTQAILGDTGFGAILNSTDAFGETGFGHSVKQIIAGFLHQRREVATFRKELRLLAKRGLSDAAIREIAGMGLAEGGGIAASLMDATGKQLRRISNLRRGVHSGATGIGVDVATAKFGTQIAREVARTTKAVERASHNTELGPKTMRRLDRALGKTEKRAKVYLDTNALDRHDGRVIAGLLS